MLPEAFLIGQPQVDFDLFLGIAHKACGVNLAAELDTSCKKTGESARFVGCLCQFSEGASERAKDHWPLTFLVVAHNADLLALASHVGAPFLAGPTLAPGVSIAVLTAALGQWERAIETSAFCPEAVAHALGRVREACVKQGIRVSAPE